ncbi:MAG: MATE family efflux transporter [Lachnospiraceae bacterium]|nr:MATE family efflux transporter [Lachnospiraceae bacterium]
MAETQQRENKMGTMAVGKLLVTMSVPLILSNLVQALYNVVDSIFVSRITTQEQIYDEAGNLISAGTDAISALGLAFPVQIVIIALAIGTSIGVSSLLSRSLGEKDQRTADLAAVHGLFLMACSYLVSLFIGLFLADKLIAGQGAVGRQLEYGTTYLRLICCCSFFVYMEIMLERLLQSTGRSHLSMIPQMTGAVINCIMDPILIYGLLGAPKLGVAGAALATVFGQFTATCIGIFLNLKKNPDIHFTIRGFRPDLQIIKNIYAVGLPAIVMQAIGSVMNFGMNSILLGLNRSAVAVFTVYYKLQSFFFMPIFGLNSSLVPIIAYNYGARRRDRMQKVYRLSLIAGFCMLFLGFLAFELIPGQLIRIFDTGDASLMTVGIPALRIIGVHYLLAWYCILTGSVFQALGNGVYSLVVSILRQLLALLPAAWLLGRMAGLAGVWWAFPIAELVSLATTVFYYLKIKQNVIDRIPLSPDPEHA